VWTDRDQWSNELEAWEWSEPVCGAVLIAHRKYGARKEEKLQWFVSEKSSGLRVTPNLSGTRLAALQVASAILSSYTEEKIKATIEANVIKQVIHQIGA
jgi:hypothetical protein